MEDTLAIAADTPRRPECGRRQISRGRKQRLLIDRKVWEKEVCIGHERLQKELCRGREGERRERGGEGQGLGLYGSTESYSGDSE
jgi:hypothetical protein